jgi:crossover junction endodeoxyribonuclease RuvC
VLALGIDPGTRNLGWGLVLRNGARLDHVAHGVIRVSASLSLSARLCEIAEGLEAVIAHHRPGLGSVEQLFFHKDPQAAAKLGHARGVVLLALGRQGIEIVEHAPARIKLTVTGHGQATKAQVAHMVRAILRIEETMPEDASDALAIAITALRLNPLTLPVTAARATSKRRGRLPEHLAALVEASRKVRGGAKKLADF